MSTSRVALSEDGAMTQPIPAPAQYRVAVDTTAGRFEIEVHREWSPHGADRFFELAQQHYYDDSRFFRVVAGKWVQFGIAGDPAMAQAWRARTIPDDRLVQSNTSGFIAFANTGPGTRSTQVFINLGDNSAQNDREPGFAPFGKVVSGMDVVARLYAGYGETSGSGLRAGRQDALFADGNRYLDENFPRLDRLIRLAVIPG
jgi:homoserine O-acetyltransferase